MRLLLVALLPLALCAAAPPSLPMVGLNKTDAWGLSVRSADKIALRKMLFDERYAELTRVMEAFQAETDKDCRRELVSLDAFESFSTAEDSMSPLLDKWVEASPESYAPLLARGIHHVAIAGHHRGSDAAAKTREAQWAAMRREHQKGLSDLNASLRIKKTVAAYRDLSQIALIGGEASAARRLGEALELCPATLMVRAKMMAMLMPRWGGSHEAMAAFAAQAPVALNKKLAVLAGYVDYDKAMSSDGEESLRHIDAALSYGSYWEFQLEKAKVMLGLCRPAEALKWADLAIEQRPQKAYALAVKVMALMRLKRWIEACDTVLYARAIDPTDSYVEGLDGKVVAAMLADAGKMATGNRAAARKLVDKAVEVLPQDPDVRAWVDAFEKAGK